MLDQRLIEADATKLDELHEIMLQQEHPEKLHDIDMKAILIDHGAVAGLNDAVRSLTAGKKVLLVTGPTVITDTKEQAIKEKILSQLEADFDVEWLVIREPEGIVHCTPENAAKIQEKLPGKDCVVGVGSGTICDLCKYGTFYADRENPLPLVIVQTALSVNAFSDNSSVMLISGVKRTVHSRYPTVLIIDLDIVTAAPPEMNVSGYGDLIATWTAPVDWYLSYTLGMGGNFHTAPSDMIRTQCERLLENSARLAACDPEVIGDLANVLTLSGLSMGLADESSPASGSEHVMSHLIDMASGVRKTGICYHGTQVAVSGIISCILWDYLLRWRSPASSPAFCGITCCMSLTRRRLTPTPAIRVSRKWSRASKPRSTGWTTPIPQPTNAGRTTRRSFAAGTRTGKTSGSSSTILTNSRQRFLPGSRIRPISPNACTMRTHPAGTAF